jgi:hypothetical protein
MDILQAWVYNSFGHMKIVIRKKNVQGMWQHGLATSTRKVAREVKKL